jgi:hypothetical protein
MTPHSLRHTCSTLLDAKGVSIKERMEHVVHSTVAMQLHYTHVGRARLREISPIIDRDVRETLGVTSFARDGRKMAAIRDLGAMKAASADRGMEA